MHKKKIRIILREVSIKDRISKREILVYTFIILGSYHLILSSNYTLINQIKCLATESFSFLSFKLKFRRELLQNQKEKLLKDQLDRQRSDLVDEVFKKISLTSRAYGVIKDVGTGTYYHFKDKVVPTVDEILK